MQLVKYPNPILTQKSKDVKISREVLDFIDEMMEFYKTELKWGNPVGLAAPQVGKNWNIFIALDKVYINPRITWRPSGGWTTREEGCFSLEENKFDYKVRRQDALRLQWIDVDGSVKEERFHGFEAQVIQHEMDHLEGKLCCGEIKE